MGKHAKHTGLPPSFSFKYVCCCVSIKFSQGCVEAKRLAYFHYLLVPKNFYSLCLKRVDILKSYKFEFVFLNFNRNYRTCFNTL